MNRIWVFFSEMIPAALMLAASRIWLIGQDWGVFEA